MALMFRQCATTAITAVCAASIRFAMAAMLGRLVAQLKMPWLDAYDGLAHRLTVQLALENVGLRAQRGNAHAQGRSLGVAQNRLTFAFRTGQGVDKVRRQFLRLGRSTASHLLRLAMVCPRFHVASM